jgi:hypothetical protein
MSERRTNSTVRGQENGGYLQGSQNIPSLEGRSGQVLWKTNNFKDFFIYGDTDAIDKSGRPNPYHYANQPWGSVMQDLRDNHKELWAACQETAVAYNAAANRHIEEYAMRGLADKEPAAETAARQQAYVDMETNLNAALEIMEPGLVKAGVDPLEFYQ